MHQQQARRSKQTTQRRDQLNSASADSNDSSLSRIFLQNPNQRSEYTLPLNVAPSLMTTAQSTIATQTAQGNLITQSFHSKSIPTFAETQLLSIYYLNRNLINQSSGNINQDSSVFVEQQDRQPIRFRAAYDPSGSTKSTQTSPPLALNQLSTHGSTLVIGANQQSTGTNNPLYEQRLKIHSGSQRLANNPSLLSDTDELLSPSELIEESRYSYEEYIIHVDNNQEQNKQISSSSPTSTSSANTIIAQPPSPPLPLPPPPPPPPPITYRISSETMLQPEDFDSDRTSRLSADDINTHSTVSSMSGSFTNQDWAATNNTSSRLYNDAPIVNPRQTLTTSTTEETTRVSSWPPVPIDIQSGDNPLETSFILDDSDDQPRIPRVQFAEQLVHVIPVSATNSVSEEVAPREAPPLPNISAPAVIPRTTTSRTNSYEQNEKHMNFDTEEDESTATTTTSSNREPISGRLQRTSGLTNLNQGTMSRPTTAPPPLPSSLPVTSTTIATTAAATTTTTTTTTTATTGVDPRLVRDQLKRLDYQLLVDTRHPINQSKWVKDHMDASDAHTTTAATTTTSGRVDALRSLFEHQSGRSSDSSTLNSPTGQIKRIEPEERPSRHGDEIRFRVKEPKISTIHHAEPIQVVQRTKQPTTSTPAVVTPLTWEDLVGVQEEHQQQKRPQISSSTSPLELDEIQQILGNRRITSLNDIGHYTQYCHTWEWDDRFWFSLTSAQRDQLNRLQQQLQQSRSRQDSGDTQIYEHSDRSAYQGDSEDNTPKTNNLNRRIRSRNSSQDNLLPLPINQTPTDETKRFKAITNEPGSTVSITGAGAWQQHKQSTISTGIGKYTETSTMHENQPSISVFGSTPNATYTRVGSQESIASSTIQPPPQQPMINKKTENQMTIIESGYSSADEPQQQQQRTNQFRPNSSTIIEEPSTVHHTDTTTSGVAGLIAGSGSIVLPNNDIQLREAPIYENLRPETRQHINEPEVDPLSYEQFIYDYFSTHARRLRSDDGTLIFLIDGQQIQMSHIRLPTNDNITLAKNVYIDAIDEYPPPFETESDQLVIFIHGESVVIPADKWLKYKIKYQNTQWIHKLERVNRHIPVQLMSIIEDWLTQHTRFLLDRNEINVDGLNIPLTGRLGLRILNLYQVRQLQSDQNYFWSELLKYLIRTGYVSFDPDEQIIHIAHSELDVQRILTRQTSPSPELIERLAKLLRLLNDIHFDQSTGSLILERNFIIPNEDVYDLFEKHQQGQTLNANELANHLLHICAYEEDQDGQSLILTLNDQILHLTPSPIIIQNQKQEEQEIVEDEVDDSEGDLSVLQWLSDNALWSSEHGREFLIRYRSMPNYVVRITGPDGIRLSNLLQQQALQLNDVLRWHHDHVQIDRTENSLRMIIKPNNNIEIVNLPLEENEKKREKVNEEKKKSTNQKTRSIFEKEEKSLVFFIPLNQQTPSDSEVEVEVVDEREGKEKEHYNQHSTSTLLQQEEQKKIKTNDDDEDDDGRERVLLLESIASLLHFVNANGSNVGTLELIQGRRLRLSLTDNSPLSQQQQQIEFNEDDTKILYENLNLDIDSCTQYLVDHIFDKIEFDKENQYLIIHYRGQMLKLKNLKQKIFQPSAKKLRLTSNKTSTTPTTINEDHVNMITDWLDQLNGEKLITITEQNDIVILPNGEDDQEQQIFLNHDDVDAYMENKINTSKPSDEPEIIGMNDIARILLIYNYIQYSNGHISFGSQHIALDKNELTWLRSIVRGVRSDAGNRETEIDLFDGEHTQVLHVPYEHMPPTNDQRVVADYLFRNGHVRYDVDTGNYAYRYVAPDIPLEDEDNSTERIGQRQVLLSHIRHIHVDEENERIELEFLHDPNHRLELPTRWYRQALTHDFERAYIVDMLLANGGTIDHDTFVFNDRTYSLQVPRVPTTSSSAPATNLQTIKLSNKQKQELIEKYVEMINTQDGIKLDNTNDLLILENQSDGSQLYLTPEHTKFIVQNRYRREDVKRFLTKHGQIKQDEFGNWLLYYNNQYVQFPPSIIPATTASSNNMSNVIRSLGQKFSRQQPSGAAAATVPTSDDDAEFRARLAQETQAEFIHRYHATIEYMYTHGLITINKRLKLIQIHFSNQTLTIPLDQLHTIVDTRTLQTTAENVIPFESHQLSKWLLDHSDTISNTRDGYIRLTHKNKTYDFPLINPNNRPIQSQSAVSTIVKRFGLTSKSIALLTKIDLTTPENQTRCATHLLDKLDQFGSINIDNETRTLILSMTPDNQQQLVVQNPVVPVTKQTLIDYLTSHGRFTLNADRTNIEYRHYDDGRVYRFDSYVRDWEDALGETNEERIIRILGEILSLNGRFLQRADRQLIISLRNGERFIIPSNIGEQLLGPINGQTIAELLVKYADNIYEEQDGKYLVIHLANQTLRLPQQKQLMSTKQSSGATTGATSKAADDPKLKLLFPFNRNLRQIQKTPSTSTLNIQPPDATNGYAIDPLLMLANYIYRAGSIYQDDLGRLVIKMNEDEIVVPRIEAINAIETINTSPHRTGTIIARLIDRIGKVQSNKAGGLIITIGKSSFELSKDLIDRANQLHRETIDIENDLPIQDQDIVQTGLNGAMTLAGRHNRQPYGPTLLPLLRQSKSVGSLSTSTIGHPWFTDDQQMLYSKDGRGDARYLNLDNYSLAWQKEAHKHGIGCEVRTLRNVAPYLDVLGYVENDPKKGLNINDLTRLHPEMFKGGKLPDNQYLTKLENDRAQVQTTLCPKPRILVIPDDETMLSSDRKTRFYVQYMYDHDAVLGADPAYVMMLPSRYPVRPTRPQLIAPHHYRDIALRDAPVYVHKKGEGEVFFENLAQYLSAEHPDVSPRTVRRMLKYDKGDEYLEYLSNKMPAADAARLLQESEEPIGEASVRYDHIPTRVSGSRTNLTENDEEEDVDGDLDEYIIENENRRRIVSPRTYYNLQNGSINSYEDQRQQVIYENTPLKSSMSGSKFVERSPSTSSLGSDMLIANTFPTRRSVLGNAPSINIPTSRNDINRTTTNPLSSLTDENYGRPVVRGRTINSGNGQNSASPEKTVTLPRSATLSGQSNDGENEGRNTVSRSTSATAKVNTSKSDTVKSTTSSSAASSRELPTTASSTMPRAQSVASPSRTSASKGGGDDTKKEKKSKFRTPSFLKKRKEKKEATHKDKP
ncbi:unnamed protein product [Adineta steineri]|uniref:Uncharacterized protein n=2 Tax=Adineta steineri TaxID=433720 RepID=A0A815I1X9_9BILA|nr:unnamed protein product [Adineta steineri]